MQIQGKKEGNRRGKIDFEKYPEVPDNWKIYSLSDLCRVRKSNGIESELYVGLEHIGQGTNRLESRGNVNDFKSAKNIFVKGDVLYGKLRPLLNKVWLATENGYCSTDILPLIPNDKVLDVIMMYILSSSRFVAYASSRSAGTKMPRSNWTDIAEFKVPLPPLWEQQRIASILSKVDDLIHKIDEIIEQAQRLKKALMQRLLTKGIGHSRFKQTTFGEIPEKWEVCKLEDLLVDIKYGTSVKANSDSKGIPVLSIPNIVKGKIDYTNLRYATVPESQQLSLLLKYGDILIVRTNGNPSYVGTCALFDKKGEWIFASYLIRIRVGNRSLPDFLTLVLQSPIAREQFQRIARTSAGNYNINSLGIKSLTIPLPAIEEQKRIVEILSCIDEKVEKGRAYRDLLLHLKNALMKGLLTGKIRVKV